MRTIRRVACRSVLLCLLVASADLLPAADGSLEIYFSPSRGAPESRVDSAFALRAVAPSGERLDVVALSVDGRLRAGVAVPGVPGALATSLALAGIEAFAGGGARLAFDDPGFDLDGEIASGRLPLLATAPLPLEVERLLTDPCPAPGVGAGDQQNCDPAQLCPDCNCTDLARDKVKEALKAMRRRGFVERIGIDDETPYCEIDILEELLSRDNILLDKEHEYTSPGVCSVTYGTTFWGAHKVYISPECLCEGNVSPADLIGLIAVGAVIAGKTGGGVTVEEGVIIAASLFLDALFKDKKQKALLEKALQFIEKWVNAAVGEGDCVAGILFLKALLAALEYNSKADTEAAKKVKEAWDKARTAHDKVNNMTAAEEEALRKKLEERAKRIIELVKSGDYQKLEEEFGIPRSCLDPKALAVEPAREKPSGGENPRSVAPVDLDGDGDLELAAANEGSSTVGTLDNPGDGDLGPGLPHPALERPRCIVAADLDGDGRGDVAVGGGGGAQALLSRGADGLVPGPPLELDVPVAALAIADLDRDGRLDLAVAPSGSPELAVFPGLDGGAFGVPSLHPAGAIATALAIADLDRDGLADVVISSDAPNGVSVLLGDADAPALAQAAFRRPELWPTGFAALGLAVIDMTGDGLPDAVVGGQLPNAVAYLPGIGGGKLSDPRPLPGPVPGPVHALAAADLDLDGLSDVLAAVPSSGDVLACFPLALESYAQPLPIPAGAGASALALADLDRDGDLDIVAACTAVHTIALIDNTFVPHLLDCDGNGVPDVCDIRTGSADCDGNGSLDACDLATGTLVDADGNGLPDLCENERFLLGGPDARLVLAVEPGVETQLTVPLRLQEVTPPEGRATPVLGASLGLENDPGVLVPRSVEPGSAVARGGGRPDDFFAADLRPYGAAIEFAVDPTLGVPLRATEPVELAVVTYVAAPGAPRGAEETTVLEWVDAPRTGAEGDVARNRIVALGGLFDAATRDIPVLLRGAGLPVFRRGDVDGSTEAEITDAIATLGWLFLGDGAPACLDAADINDDGNVDISDATSLLQYLFLGGFEPPAPGPHSCGADPSADGLEGCGAAGC